MNKKNGNIAWNYVFLPFTNGLSKKKNSPFISTFWLASWFGLCTVDLGFA